MTTPQRDGPHVHDALRARREWLDASREVDAAMLRLVPAQQAVTAAQHQVLRAQRERLRTAKAAAAAIGAMHACCWCADLVADGWDRA